MDARYWGQSRVVAGGGRTVLVAPSPPWVGVLAESWSELCRGRARIAREYSSEAGHHLEIAWGDAHGPSAHELEMLTPVLLGELQKVVALTVKRSPSSVATVSAAALRGLGLACRPRETPLLVVMMAQAWHGVGAQWAPVECRLTPLGPRTSLLSVTRPDAWLDGVLSPCERKVLRHRVNGLSHDDVARHCGISRRTVANQIASGYRKLGVSGRLELLNRILIPTGPTDVPPRRPAARPRTRIGRLTEAVVTPPPAS
jgi:DNA-binding NarL/FixJ family response regulator